jgi:hypothetical protein
VPWRWGWRRSTRRRPFRWTSRAPWARLTHTRGRKNVVYRRGTQKKDYAAGTESVDAEIARQLHQARHRDVGKLEPTPLHALHGTHELSSLTGRNDWLQAISVSCRAWIPLF